MKSVRVYCDTNIFLDNPIKQPLLDLIKLNKIFTHLRITLVMSEVVKKELVKNISIKRDADVYAIKDAAKNLRPYIKITEPDVLKNEVLKKIESVIKKSDIEVITIDSTQIKLKDLVDKAVWYQPPFEEKKEKGFKDSIIAESIIQDIKRHSKAEPILLCNDKVLLSYLIEKLPTVKASRYLTDIESYLKLNDKNLTKKAIESITKEAEVIFYKSKNNGGFYLGKGGLQETIRQKFSAEINSPRSAFKPNNIPALDRLLGVERLKTYEWKLKEKYDEEISIPTYIKEEDGKYFWVTYVTIKNVYEVFKVYLWTFTHVITIAVHWTTDAKKVRNKIVLSNPEAVSTKLHRNDIENSLLPRQNTQQSPFDDPTLTASPSISSSSLNGLDSNTQLEQMRYKPNIQTNNIPKSITDYLYLSPDNEDYTGLQ